MARINIEDAIFKDIRFDELKIKLGNMETALGAMVRAWSLAQKFFLNAETNRLIPIAEWKKQKINPAVLESGLAEQRGEFIYVCGSNEQFSWLLQCQTAGKKGGRPPNAIKQKKGKPLGLPPKGSERVSNPLTLTPSLSLTLTPSPSEEVIKNLKNDFNQVLPDSPKANEVIGLYYSLWKEKYGSKPPLTGKHFSLIKAIVKTNGIARTSELLKSYFEMPDAWFIKRRHDVESFNANLNQIAHFGDTGTIITNQQVRQADNQMANQQLLKSYEGKTK